MSTRRIGLLASLIKFNRNKLSEMASLDPSFRLYKLLGEEARVIIIVQVGELFFGHHYKLGEGRAIFFGLLRLIFLLVVVYILLESD